MHKQTDQVLFVKVQNDGFNLGAQRRAVVNSDLPEATRLLRSWMTAPAAFEGDGLMAQAVARERIGASGDFNLSGERYITTVFAHTHYEVVRIADVCDVNPRKSELDDSDKQFCFQRHIALLRPSPAVDAQYLYFFMSSPLAFQQAEKTATGVAQKTVSLGSLRNFKIPLPDLATQRSIVAEIEAEQALVAANRELIRRFEAKIKSTIDRVWSAA